MYGSLDAPYDKKGSSFHLTDSTITNLVPAYKTHTRPFELNLVDSLAEKWIRTIKENTSAADIICSNNRYIGSMLSAMSGRANAARLFLEVSEPDVRISEFGSSKMVVWLREYNGKFSSEINACIDKFGYRVVTMDGSAAILMKDSGAQVEPVKPVLKTSAAFLALAAALAAAFIDITRSPSEKHAK